MARGFSAGHLERQRANPPPLALLLRRARVQSGLSQVDMAKAMATSSRTLSRWEAGDARPLPDMRLNVVTSLQNVDGETWRAIVTEMKLPLDAMLARFPVQRAKLPQPPAPPPPPPPQPTTAPAPPPKEMRARFDDIVRATAEELDVTARRVRAVLGNVLSDIAEMGLSPLEARAHILQRGEPRGKGK